jgi:hypothetical protein
MHVDPNIRKDDLDELSKEDLHSIVKQRLRDELAINGSGQKVAPTRSKIVHHAGI